MAVSAKELALSLLSQEQTSPPQILNQWQFPDGKTWFLAEVPIKDPCADPDVACSGRAFVRYIRRSKGIIPVTCQAKDENDDQCKECTGTFLVDLVKLQMEARGGAW